MKAPQVPASKKTRDLNPTTQVNPTNNRMNQEEGKKKASKRNTAYLLRERVEYERMVTSQVTSESLGRPLDVGSWLLAGKKSRVSHGKVCVYVCVCMCLCSVV